MVVVSPDRSRSPQRRAQLESQLGAANPGFRRSSERQVKDPNETYAVEEDRRRNKAMLEFEAIGMSAGSHSVLVEPVTLERATTDGKLYDLEGVTYP